jgi:hypothetical protein
VIFMDRPVDEVAASQAKMIARRGRQTPPVGLARMKAKLSSHRQLVLRGMRLNPHFQVLVVSYPELVRDPDPWIDKIAAFLGQERLPRPEAMRAAVDPSLHRNRA